jgi:hypothetical protein
VSNRYFAAFRSNERGGRSILRFHRRDAAEKSQAQLRCRLLDRARSVIADYWNAISHVASTLATIKDCGKHNNQLTAASCLRRSILDQLAAA